MEQNSLDKFNRHCGKSIKVELKNEDGTKDEFEFNPLNMDQLTKLLIFEGMVQNLSEKGDEKRQEILAKSAPLMIDILKDIVKTSYPDITDDIVSKFLANNFVYLSTEIIGKLAPTKIDAETQTAIADKIKQFKEKHEQA